MEHWTEYSRFFTALFVILDPFAAVPIFLVLTKNYTAAERGRVASIASTTVLVVLVAASLSGETLLLSMGAMPGIIPCGWRHRAVADGPGHVARAVRFAA